MFTTDTMGLAIVTADVHLTSDNMAIIALPTVGITTFIASIASTADTTPMIGQLWPRGR